MPKKMLTCLIAVALLAAMLLGCAPAQSSAPTSAPASEEATPEPTPMPTEAPPDTDANLVPVIEEADPAAILQLHYNNDFSNLDPALTSDGQGGILGCMMPPLMDTNADYSLAPGIAESYSVNEDSTVYTFKIPDGILFHDGTPCDAEAIKWNYDRQVGENATPEMPYAQIARVLDTNESVVRGQLHRARRTLSVRMEQWR